MSYELTTSIEIDAPPERVWEVLIDFDHYPEWNPFMRIAGRPNEGATLTVHLMPPGGRESVFEPDVTRCERHRELVWVGHLIVPGLFDGEHRFRLEPLGGGERTRFEHTETFSGLLSGPFMWFMGDETRAGFVAMNEGLKTRVEGLVAADERETDERETGERQADEGETDKREAADSS
ncbi:SRPBCC domain-containing protein [Haloferax mediterranei ATCC 33500]|uniref:Cyclase/dehydrase n=1 Tax=Haloferax mediterranei (strain ATCC 33500 / DSM 1411 / JCM 8866 / NBRC 14739 / NCIMB 2177 / R-4) TaxID=523841 RepID=I3R118_HALMT|nr:SRPBCC domain-containing protein [Haloferax mediterranei]AFK17928.1 cyclase/dehydrase [Haloferax mediterranei ATCC 33500]AHZ22650.1 polyketide cyclase [Haloferax mediterranei ATCC 33500]EMA02795.1 cyclase/dehydrase [Haloferax mediterranei ATCC 33500]MDX5988020.1 SRPBCC domain-containing protein [Haloferax mediterranei ATCC 33500]QCQ74482.1 SRPBCC domain-containing protein [Haloferax mediterranei ATCC 33500]